MMCFPCIFFYFASSLRDEDLHRFCHVYRDNKYLFRNLPCTDEISEKVDELSKRLKGYVFMKRVVNSDALVKMMDDFNCKFG